MSPTNLAAWLPFKAANPLQVGEAPYTAPGPKQIIIQNKAVATNQVDFAKQIIGDLGLSYVKYPFILGGDVAGIVAEIGSEVKGFGVGDRVLGHAAAIVPASNDPAEGGFQNYTIVREHLAAKLPGNITFEQASVLPLCLSTAAYGLFHKDFLALDLPTVPSTTAGEEGSGRAKQMVLITGGASSVGCSAIQLAKAAGYEVLSTASPKNFGYIKKLGASQVFDYRSDTVIEDLLATSKDRHLAGAYAIGEGSDEMCTAVLRRHQGTTHKFVASAGGGVDPEAMKSFVGTAGFVASTLWTNSRVAIKARIAGVRVKFVDGIDLCKEDGVVGQVYCDFVPGALANGSLIPAPEPMVVGSGLEKIQDALDLHSKGVSARKIVVTL